MHECRRPRKLMREWLAARSMPPAARPWSGMPRLSACRRNGGACGRSSWEPKKVDAGPGPEYWTTTGIVSGAYDVRSAFGIRA